MKKHVNEKENKEPNNHQTGAKGSAENQIIIQNQQPGTYHINLVDGSGNIVYETTSETKGQDIVLDITEANLDPGMYLVKLTSDEAIKVVKIYKK